MQFAGEQHNPLTRQFVGTKESDNQLNETVYYENLTFLRCLGLAENRSKVLTVVFDDSGTLDGKLFIKQFTALREMSNELDTPALFACKQPGHVSHYITGIYYRGHLAIFNPIGRTKQKDFYNILKIMQRKLRVVIFLNEKKVQLEEKLVNCGPINVELLLHLQTNYSANEIRQLLLQFWVDNKHQSEELHGLSFYPADFSPLLPMSIITSQENYLPAMKALRQQHFDILSTFVLPEEHAEKPQDYLQTRFVNSDAHIILRQMVYRKDNLDYLQKKDHFRRLREFFPKIEISAARPARPAISVTPDIKDDHSKRPSPTVPTLADFKNNIMRVEHTILKMLLMSGLTRADKDNSLNQYAVKAEKIINSWCKFILAMRAIATILTLGIFALAYYLHGKRLHTNTKVFAISKLVDRYRRQFIGGAEVLRTSPDVRAFSAK